ncbi:hypothetical protein BC939DRAFT_307222 [Gamsiella multidivaricata]|uniref:uncharacterized protein n=1 Tax=Gamsiella multidivaricata TaxID=101098 RepID=UPI0022205502|nr:uncharacterized protein BC939DRAFT_307222 [Gamsiella multidivaricata]KAI7818106.1 hypothetical protein BC939DRAFT_307222 [Gamsiella multidivaricata]
MQVEQPRRLERIASAYPKPSPRRPQDSQQQHKRNKKKTPAQTGPLLHTDSHSSDDNDCRSDTSCTRHSNPTSPISPVCNTSTRLHKGPTTGRKPQSAKLSRHRDHLHRSVLHENASMSQTQTQTQTQTQAQSVQAQAPRSSQECQRAPSLSPGAKRALGRPRQNEHSHSHHQRHSHSQADPSETLRATLSPRVTTTVTMTTAASTRTTAGAVSNRAGSASEPDDVGLCKSPSSDSKRARVQNGSGKRSTAASDTNRGSASTMQQQSQQEVVDISSDESDHGASNEGQDLDNERDLQKMLADMQGASSHDQDNGHSSVTGPSASGAGSRRGSQTLYHYHHQCQHHQHRQQELSNGNGYRTPTASNGSNPRSSHQTHTRNFSSPSLLDSFTSPEPMLSPIQSYFGSDPNSPASTFSLPSHDQYPRLTIDPSATMDGYHGFATHPWSEQSTTPSRALSHRWTRRLSQSDAYPNVANSANSHSSTTRPRPASSVYASSTTDRPWQVTSDIDSAQALDVDDSVQGALDDETMDNTYSDHESTYNHPLDHNRNLRTSDYGDDMDHSPSLRYSHRASTVDAEDDEEDNDSHMIGSDYEVEDDEDNDDGDDGDDDDDGMGEGYDVEGVLSTNYLQEQLLFSSASSRTNHTSGSQSAQTIESDAALARRLQDEEYSDLLRERVGLVCPQPS